MKRIQGILKVYTHGNQKLYILQDPNGYRTLLFEMKLEVMPYLGAHNSIGVDHITIRVSSGKVKIEKFEHIKDKPIPPWLQRNYKQKSTFRKTHYG